MTSISQYFQSLRVSKAPQQEARNHCALIPFITAGDPDLETTAAALQILDKNGADLIELGVPYADPLADGAVIQAAATRALAKGTTLEQVLAMVTKVTPTLKAPLILFTYYNPILNRGITRFLKEIAQAGVKGLVVPDLPLEEAQELLETATSFGIEIILLVAPTSSPDRIEAIARQSQGFIYLVSVTGVTGMRSQLGANIKDLLMQMQNITTKPIGVGFGISQPEQARACMDWGANAAIVGSAFVQRLATGTPSQGLRAIEKFSQELKSILSPQNFPNS